MCMAVGPVKEQFGRDSRHCRGLAQRAQRGECFLPDAEAWGLGGYTN